MLPRLLLLSLLAALSACGVGFSDSQGMNSAQRGGGTTLTAPNSGRPNMSSMYGWN